MSLEFPPQAAWLFAALTGEVPPDGDEDKMFALAEVHRGLHGKLTGDIQQQVAEALGITRHNFGGDASTVYQEAMKGFLGGQEGLDYFNSVSDQAQLLAEFTRESATQLQYTKYMIIAQLIELLVEAVVAAALAFFFGASIQAYLARQAIVKYLIKSRLARLIGTLLMHEIINVGMGVAMDLLVQWSQLKGGTRDGFDSELTKGAALSGAVQGLLAGPFHALGNKFGKGLANLFGKDGGKNLGKKLDDVFPPPSKAAGPKGAAPKAGGAGPKSFGDDLADAFRDHLPKTAGPGGKQAGDDFVHAVGDAFQKHLGGKEATDVGRNWARTLLDRTGKKDLPDALEQSLKPLGKQLDAPTTQVLSRGTADVLGKDILQSMARGTNESVFEGIHAAVSEGTYNLVFSDEHEFKTSGLTFGSGMVEGRVGNFMESGGEKLGAGLRGKLLDMTSSSGFPGDAGGTGRGGDGTGNAQQNGSTTSPATTSTTNTALTTDTNGLGGLDGLAVPPDPSAVPGTPESTGENPDDANTPQEHAQVLGTQEKTDDDQVTSDTERTGAVVPPVPGPVQQGGGPPNAVNTAGAPNQTSGPSNQSGQSPSSNARPGNTPVNTSAEKVTDKTADTTADAVNPPVQSISTQTDTSTETQTQTESESEEVRSPQQSLIDTESKTPPHPSAEDQRQNALDENGQHRSQDRAPTGTSGNDGSQQQVHTQTSDDDANIQQHGTQPPVDGVPAQQQEQEETQTSGDDLDRKQEPNPTSRLARDDEDMGNGWHESRSPLVNTSDSHTQQSPDNTGGEQLGNAPHESIELTNLASTSAPVSSAPKSPLSSDVAKFGTAEAEGTGGVQLSPLHDDVATGVQEQVLTELNVPASHEADVRSQLASLLSPQALHDNRLMLLSRDGHRITVTVDGTPRPVDVRLNLSDPRPTAVFGNGNRKPPHNNEQRQAAAFDTSSQSGSTAARPWAIPYSNTFSKVWQYLTGIPVSANLSGTHQQRSLTSTVSGVVNSTSLLRSTEPASPYDYRASWSVRQPQPPSSGLVTEQPWQPAQTRGTVTAWFPEHLARPHSDTDTGPAHVISRESEAFNKHLDKLPLWAMDSMSDPGSLLKQARQHYGTEFGKLSPDSLKAVEKFFGGEHQLGALPLQRRRDVNDTRTPGTFSPVLLDKAGNAYGMFRVVADVDPRRGDGLHDIKVGEKYSFERYLDRQLKVDSLSKVSSSLGGDASAGVVLNKEPAEVDKALRDFHVGGSVAPKAGYTYQKDKGFGAGATHNVVHNLRTNTGHVLTPASVTYHIEFIAADGSRSGLWSAPPTDVRIRTLAPDTVNGTRPAEERKLPPELDRLDAIGVSTTPVGIHGDGVTSVLGKAEKWLQDEGFLPKPGELSALSAENLTKARLENLRRLTLLGSPNGLLGAVDELVDGGLLIHFNKPETGGGVRRVQLRLSLDRRDTDRAAAHLTSLSGVHMPSTSGLTVPGNSQQVTATTKTFAMSGELTGAAVDHLRASLTGDYKGTWQTTETSSVSASVTHSQFILTSNQTTELFRVPAVLKLDVFEGTGQDPVFSWDSQIQAPADRASEVFVDLAVPEGRTRPPAAENVFTYDPARVDPPGAVKPEEQPNAFRLPDSSLVDVMRGSGKLYEAVDAMLRDLSERPPPDQVPGELPPPATANTPPVATSTSPSSSSWWSSATAAAKSVAGYVLHAGSVVQHTLTGTDRADHGLLLNEAIHAQLAPAALLARSHQITKGRYVIDDLFVPGAVVGTDLVVEVRAVVSNPRSLGEVRQYGETDLGVVDAASHQVTKGSAHEGGPGFTLKSGKSRAEAEAARNTDTDADTQSASASRAGNPVTGGAGAKGVWGKGSSRSVTSAASTGMTRVPSESGTQHRISADVTYEVTIRRGLHGVTPLNVKADAVTRTVSVPGGIQFLATPDQLRRSGNETLKDLAGPVDESRPRNVPLPRRFRTYGLLGLAAVLDVTPLKSALTPPVAPPAGTGPGPGGASASHASVTGDRTNAVTDRNRDNEDRGNEDRGNEDRGNEDRNDQDQDDEDRNKAGNDAGNGAAPEPSPDHDLLRDRLTALVEKHAPGSLTPGHASYVPGLRQRIADYTSPAALGVLPGRGSDKPLTFTFPYAGRLLTQDVTVKLYGRLAWDEQQLDLVRGRKSGEGSALENFTSHAPANITEATSRTTRWGFGLPGSVNTPTSGDRKAVFGPGVAHSTLRTDTTSNTSTAEDRVWQRTEGGDEFTLAYVFSAEVTIGGKTHALPEPVDAAVTVRFSGDRDQQAPDRELLDDLVYEQDPTRSVPQLIGATPLQPTGHEIVYGLTNQQQLLAAVREVAPALDGDGLGTGLTDEGAAIRLTELVHGGKLTIDPVRGAAGLGGEVTGTGKHPQVTMSTKVFNPRPVDSTRGVTVDRVRAVGFSTSASSSTTRSTAFTLSVSGTLTADGKHSLGVSVPLNQYQSVPGGQGGGISAAGRRWEKTGTAGKPDAQNGLRTHEVEVDTVTEVIGPDGTVRHVTGTAVMRVPERDLLGLGVFADPERGDGIWDLSATGDTSTGTLAASIKETGPLPEGAVPQLWLDLGTDPTPEARLNALRRASEIARTSGLDVELALRDAEGTRFWTFDGNGRQTTPSSTEFNGTDLFELHDRSTRDRDDAARRLDAFQALRNLGREGAHAPLTGGRDRLEQLQQAIEANTTRLTALDERLADLSSREAESRTALDGLNGQLDKIRTRLSATPPPHPDMARRNALMAEALRDEIRAQETELTGLAHERARVDADLDATRKQLRLDGQERGLRQTLANAEQTLADADRRLADAATQLADVHEQGGGTNPVPRPVGTLFEVPPPTDPTTQSLVSQPVSWPSPQAPANGPGGTRDDKPNTVSQDHTSRTGPHPVRPPRPVGKLVDVPALRRELRRFLGAPTAAVNTARFDPQVVQSGQNPGQLDGSMTLIRNHVRREQLPDGRTVRHFFVTLPVALSDGLSPQHLADLRARMQSALDEHVNVGYELPESGDQLLVTVELVNDPGHSEAVKITNAAVPGRADQRHWDIGHSDAVLIHETLHYLGLADEYSDASAENPHLFRRNAHASGVHSDGVMVHADDASLLTMPQDYLRTIERVSMHAVIPLHTADAPLPPPVSPASNRMADSDHTGAPSWPTSAAPPGWSRPLSDYVRNYGGQGFDGVGMEQFDPLSTAQLDDLAAQVAAALTSSGRPLSASETTAVREEIGTQFGTAALNARMPYVLSEHGYAVTVQLDDGPHTVDVRLTLSDPVTSTRFSGHTLEDPQRRIEKRATSALESSSPSGSVNPRSLPIAFTGSLLAGAIGMYTGLLFSPSLSVTHNQRSFSSTTADTVAQTQVMRNNTPSHPVDFTTHWQVRVRDRTGGETPNPSRDPEQGDAVPLVERWGQGQEHGTLTVQFPDHVATVPAETPPTGTTTSHTTTNQNTTNDTTASHTEIGANDNSADNTGIGAGDDTGNNTRNDADLTPVTTDDALGSLPLWGVDSIKDPGAIARAAAADPEFRKLLDSLSEQSRNEVLTLLSETNQRGGLPLQRVDRNGKGGQYTPLLYTPGGKAVGMLRLEARIERVENAAISTVSGNFFLESHLTRTMKLDTSVKISSGLGLDVAVNASADLAASIFTSAADWVIGLTGGFKGGWKRSWTHGHNSGGSTTVNHTLRTTKDHRLVPFTLTYTAHLVGRDGTGPSFDLKSSAVRIRMLPDSVGMAPNTGNALQPSAEIAQLQAIGLSATPLRIDGTERIFDATEKWLRDAGFLPPAPRQTPGSPLERANGLVTDVLSRPGEKTVAARLANLRLFEQMRSQLGLRAALDDMAGGAHRVWLTLPGGLTGPERRVELSLEALRRTSEAVTQVRSLDDVETINMVGLSMPGSEQKAVASGWSAGGGGSLSGPAGSSPVGASGGYTYTYNSQWGVTATDGNGIGHDQLVLTRNKATEVFSIPADFRLTVTESNGHEPVPPFTTVVPPDSTTIQIDPEASPTILIAVPADRTTPVDSLLAPQPTGTVREVTTTGTNSDIALLSFRPSGNESTSTPAPNRSENGESSTTPPAPIRPIRLPDDAFVDLVKEADLIHKTVFDGFRQIIGEKTETVTETEAESEANASSQQADPATAKSRGRIGRALIGAEANDHTTALAEQLHTAINAGQLAAHAHQIFKGGYVIEGLVLPGMTLDTEYSVEIQGYATAPKLLSDPKGHGQYIETSVMGSASHASQKSTGSSHDHAGTLTLKPSAESPVSWLQPSGGYTYSARRDHNESRTASSTVTRTPAEAMTLLRMGADTTFVITIRRGHRNLFLNAAPQVVQKAANLGPSVVRMAVDVPGGVQFLTTPGQLRRNREFFPDIAGLTPSPDKDRTVAFPRTLRDGRAFGIGSVLNAVPLAPSQDSGVQYVPDTERNRFGDTIKKLVEKAAPGLLTPGDSFSPGARARINDLSSTAGMRMLPSRGPGNPMRVHFVHVRNGIARLVEVSVRATPVDDLSTVMGIEADTGSGQENTFTQVPGNTQVSDVVTTKHSLTGSSGTRYPRPPVGQHADTLALQGTHSSGRAVTTTSATTSDQRFWLRTDNAAEFRITYEYHVDVRTKVLPFAPVQLAQDALNSSVLTDSRWAKWLDSTLDGFWEYTAASVDDTPPVRVQVDVRLTGSDVHEAPDTRTTTGGPERKLPRNGRVVVHRFTGVEQLRAAVNKVAPSLGFGGAMPFESTEPGSEAGDLAAVQFTRLVQDESVEFGALNMADLLGIVPPEHSDDRVTFSVDLLRPVSLAHTGSMAMDRVDIQARNAASSAVQSDSSAVNVQVKYDLNEEKTATLGTAAPLVQGQPQRPAAGGSHTVTDRSWQRQGVTSEPKDGRVWQTHLVTVETRITVTGPAGEEQVRGTAVVRLPERDLLGLGVLPGHVTSHVFDGESLLRENDHEDHWADGGQNDVARALATAIRTAEPDGPGAELWLDVRETPPGNTSSERGGDEGARIERAKEIAELVAGLLGRPVRLGLVTRTGMDLTDFAAPVREPGPTTTTTTTTTQNGSTSSGPSTISDGVLAALIPS
ncbi:hypothetical protein [Streptomyces sp. NPDC014734]|uniref:WXG100-like domain-containing protein n=1 Tax=Streptomyces sp. NPDC014734 TaxID=3364886 RepID=UPI003703427A